MLKGLRGQVVYVKQVGLSVAEVYYRDSGYSLYLKGDQVACYMGSSKSFKDCVEEINCLVELARDLVRAK